MRYVGDKWIQRARETAERIVEQIDDHLEEPDEGEPDQALAVEFVQQMIGALLEDLDAARTIENELARDIPKHIRRGRRA